MILSLSSLLICSFNKYSFSTNLAKYQVMVSKTILIYEADVQEGKKDLKQITTNWRKSHNLVRKAEKKNQTMTGRDEEELTWQSLRCGRK